MPLFGTATPHTHVDSSASQSIPLCTSSIIEPALTALPRLIYNNNPELEQAPLLSASSRSQIKPQPKLNAPAAAAASPRPRDVPWPCHMSPSPYTSPPVRLVVGGPSSRSPQTPQTTFYVHADLLTSVSPFFRAALDTHNDQAGFLEARTLTLRLPEERPEDVGYLVQWLYAPRGVSAAQSLYHDGLDLPLRRMDEYKRQRVRDRPDPPAFGPLVRLYILADRLDIGGGLRAAICARVREVGAAAAAVPSRDDVGRLWDGVLSGSMRRCDEEGPEASGRDGGTLRAGGEGRGDDLMAVVLDMYSGMRGWAVFEDGDEHEHEEEGIGWHPVFMRALVVKLLREKRELREATRGQASKCSGGTERHGGEGKPAAGQAPEVPDVSVR